MIPQAVSIPSSPGASWGAWDLAVSALTGLVAGAALTALIIPVLRRAGVIDIPSTRGRSPAAGARPWPWPPSWPS